MSGGDLARAVICVPARDEADRLPRLLRTLAGQRGSVPGRALRVVVVANNCTDATAAQARAFAGEVSSLDLRVIERHFPSDEAHVGSARRCALDAGADWIAAEGPGDGVLLTTDADAWLPEEWAGANLRALAAADLVGGRLVIDPEAAGGDAALSALHRGIERYWAGVRALEERLDPQPHDPAPRHGDHTGASLALSATLYRALGGLPGLPCGEDTALVRAALLAGQRLRHCPAVSVFVSDRRHGRVEGGMATEMRRRSDIVRTATPYRLPAPEYWQARILGRARLRRAWAVQGEGAENARRAALHALGLPASMVAGLLAAPGPNALAFVERASLQAEAVAPAPPLVDLQAALAVLAALLREGEAAIAAP